MIQVKEALKDYYEIEKDTASEMLYLVNKQNGQRKLIPMRDGHLFLTYGANVKVEELEKLIAEGKAIMLDSKTIYKEVYSWDDDTLCRKFYGYDHRTAKYFEAVKNNMGFVRESHGYEEEDLRDSYEVKVWDNASPVEIGKTKDGLWCAQFSQRTNVDDYDITRFYFRNKPTKTNIVTLNLISQIEMDFMMRTMKLEFNCWECGRHVHWLDVPGDIFEKYECAKDERCGMD
jgi:hypothetical protein